MGMREAGLDGEVEEEAGGERGVAKEHHCR